MEQVITIDENGVIEGLMHKRGTAVDLRLFGEAAIERVSLVEFDETKQKFFVRFLKGALAGRILSHPLYAMATGVAQSFKAKEYTMLFDDYEDAVAAEVTVLNGLQRLESPVNHKAVA